MSTVAGSGRAGRDDGPLLEASFDEPAGIAYHDGRLYVADTNNHSVRTVDLAAGRVSTLELRGL